MIIKLAIKNIYYNYQSSLLNLVLIAVGIGSVTFFSLLQVQFENKFEKNIEGIDMVLGASGSPLQLILSAIYHIDAPTGNISAKDAQKWMKHPYIKKAIPLAYGDSYQRFSIVGSTEDFIKHYEAELLEGKVNNKNFEVVIGYEVAKKLKIKLGKKFHGTHGNHEEGEVHENVEYIVTGILKPTGKIIDQLIISTIESVWEIHAYQEKDDHEHEEQSHHLNHENHQGHRKEYTAVILKNKNPIALFQLPRIVKQDTPEMQLAIPIIEINRLFANFGLGIKILSYLSFIIIVISGLSIFLSLLNTLKERKFEIAIMRAIGAGKLKVFSMILLESVLLCIIGYIIGASLGTTIYSLASIVVAQEYNIYVQPFEIDLWQQAYLIAITIVVAIVAAIIPALKVYSLDISKTLANS